jgi:TonB family protein
MRKRLLAALLPILVASTALSAQTPADSPNPVLLEAAAPTYPRSRFSNPSRTVLVGLTVNADGAPENLHIVHSGGDRFDKNAIDTVRQYKFKPASKNGQSIARDIQVEVNYKAK